MNEIQFELKIKVPLLLLPPQTLNLHKNRLISGMDRCLNSVDAFIRNLKRYYHQTLVSTIIYRSSLGTSNTSWLACVKLFTNSRGKKLSKMVTKKPFITFCHSMYWTYKYKFNCLNGERRCKTRWRNAADRSNSTGFKKKGGPL